MRPHTDYAVARATAEILQKPATGKTRLGALAHQIYGRASGYCGWLVQPGAYIGPRSTVSSLARSMGGRFTQYWKKGRFIGTISPNTGDVIEIYSSPKIFDHSKDQIKGG